MPTWAKNVTALFIAISSIALQNAAADDIELTLPIDAVTVYSSGAEVTRKMVVNLPAGEHRLIFGNLPAGIDSDRLRLQINNAAVRLGGLQLEEIHEGALVSPQEQALQTELDLLLDTRLEISDEVASAQTQLTLLDSLAAGGGAGQQAPIGAADLSATLEVLATSGNAAREVIRNANRRLRDLDRQIEQKRFELAQVGTRQQVSNALTVSIAVSTAISTPVLMTYPVQRAGWRWLYEARLDTEAGFLELHRQASISQSSGENWDSVALTVATGATGGNTAAPALNSLLVDFYRPQANLRRESQGISSAPQFDAVEEVTVTGSYIRSSAGVVASQYAVNFEIPGRVTIAADSQEHMLPIDQRGVDVDITTRAFPEFDPSAYLEAVFMHEDTVPMQAGEMQLYRDGTFIGSRSVDAFMPQEKVRLPFGKDERIRIVVLSDAEESRDGGVIRRAVVEDRRVRYAITSFHPEAVALEVLARIPVPGNDAISVSIDRQSTPFDETDIEGNTGVNLWNVEAKPGETVELRHYYSISYPQDSQLQFGR